MKPLDIIGGIELAYDRSKDEAAWLEDLLRVVAPAFGIGAPTTAFAYELVGNATRRGTFASVGVPPELVAHYDALHEQGEKQTGRSARVAYECDMFTLLSRVIGPDAVAASRRAAGMQGEDALGLRANVTADSGIVITTHVPRGFRIRHRNVWTRFAAHVGAALRLRRTSAAASPEHALAVLSPRGRLEHGNDETFAARRELADAAQNMDRARGKLRRLDGDAASELWRAMVGGEWSLVDWLDHDGKRFLLAQSNRIATRALRSLPLSEREQQIVQCAAMGHSNKLIAYDLGLSPGTVSVVLRRASRKLGVSGRVALIRAVRDAPKAPAGRSPVRPTKTAT